MGRMRNSSDGSPPTLVTFDHNIFHTRQARGFAGGRFKIMTSAAAATRPYLSLKIQCFGVLNVVL